MLAHTSRITSEMMIYIHREWTGPYYQSGLVAVKHTGNKEGAIRVKVGEILYKHEGYLYERPPEITSLSILRTRGPLLTYLLHGAKSFLRS
jgi:hypothetical protein